MKNEQTIMDQPALQEENRGNPPDLDSFRKEIAALQAEETAKKGPITLPVRPLIRYNLLKKTC